MKVWIEERGRRLKAAGKGENLAKRQWCALEWDETEMRMVEVGIECRVKEKVDWGRIRKVVAFKRDLWSVDQVHVIVETDDCVLELDEDIAEFWEFQTDLPNHLPGAMGAEEFWQRVVFPAYDTCLTLVWQAKQD